MTDQRNLFCRRPIPPPFPDPRRWREVSMKQSAFGQHIWMVPRIYDGNILGDGIVPTLGQFSDKTESDSGWVNRENFEYQGRERGDFEDPCANDGDDGVEEEYITLSLNEEWADRLSATIQRMKEKRKRSFAKSR